MPLLSRWGLVLGVAILFAVVILGGNLFGGDQDRVARIALPLREFGAFPAGNVPTDAPKVGRNENGVAEFGAWALSRARRDWRQSFRDAGRAWGDPNRRTLVPSPGPVFVADPEAWGTYGAGSAVALEITEMLGIPGRFELAKRDVGTTRDLTKRYDSMIACLAGAWGRTLVSPARLAKVAAPESAEYVRLGAEVGDPSVCDTFSDGAQ